MSKEGYEKVQILMKIKYGSCFKIYLNIKYGFGKY